VGPCGGSSFRAENKALEILFLVDTSASNILPARIECLLNLDFCPAWNVTFSELGTFVNDPRSAGISVALRYFGKPCDPRVYETPDVAMGRLPEHTTAIMESLRATQPFDDTPTRPALEGALSYARRRTQLPGYNARMIVVLITDDDPDPEDCADNDVPALTRVAAKGAAFNPPLATYVFVTTIETALDAVARAGATERSIYADLGQVGALSAALNNLRERELAGLPCEYALPTQYFQRVNDPALVNLRRDGAPLGRVSGANACDRVVGGWYYDDPVNPSRILTCQSTCSALRAGGTVDIQLECPTVILY
jgi:hypothetical protein